MFETNILSKKADVADILQKLGTLNYKITYSGQDTIVETI